MEIILLSVLDINNGIIICWAAISFVVNNFYIEYDLPISYTRLLTNCIPTHILTGIYTELPSNVLVRWDQGASTLSKVRLLINSGNWDNMLLRILCIGY